MLRSTIKALLDNSTSFERRAQTTPTTTLPSPAHKATPAIINILAPLGYGIVDGSEVRALPAEKYVDVQVVATPNAKWRGKPDQNQQIKHLLDPICTQFFGIPCKPTILT